MPVDQGTVDLIKEELAKGKAPEELMPKLRKLGYSDDEIAEIFSKAKGEVVVIKRPSRVTIFKTVLSVKVIALILLLVVAIGGIVYMSGALFITSVKAPEDQAKTIADNTPEASLFNRAIELQNRVVECLPELLATYNPGQQASQAGLFSELGKCTIVTSKKLDVIEPGVYIITYTAEEAPGCTHEYIFNNNILAVTVDINQKTSTANWLVPPPFSEEAINALLPYPGCSHLIQYTQLWVDSMP